MKRIDSIVNINREIYNKSIESWNSIAKPLHSLGLLESYVSRIAAITGDVKVDIGKRCVVVMCADNGVVEEGITQSDSSVTGIVAREIAKGSSNINKMAENFSIDVFAVDIGMKSDISAEGLINRKIAYGTNNMAKGSAMSIQEAQKAITAGIDIVKNLKAQGYKIIITGEMGIGNTSTSSALASVILGVPARDVTGRGAGLDDLRLEKKISVVNKAIEINKPDIKNPIEALAKVGGFDIAGMTGIFLGGAIYKIPVVIDGFISAVSAAMASLIKKESADYMLCSHVSGESAGNRILEFLGKKPLINAQMRLGEGTGGVLLLPMLDAALSVYNSAHRFEELPMERYREFK